MSNTFMRLLGGTSAIGLAIMLGACEPDSQGTADKDSFSLLGADGPLDWPMDGFVTESAGSADRNWDWTPLSTSVPMTPRATRAVSYAPEWNYPAEYVPEEPVYASYGDYADYDRYSDFQDYAPYDDYGFADARFDDVYYGGSDSYNYDGASGGDSYAFLALAAVLGGLIGDSPPDYYFDYGDSDPWVWVTSDRYVRYAEPISTGFRYYYYAPGADRPFLVRDPYYSYGYRSDRLIAIYDGYGRVLTSSRALSLRPAATTYFKRGVDLHEAAVGTRYYGVPAPVWQTRRTAIVSDQIAWDLSRARNKDWQKWDKKYNVATTPRWRSERIARRYASERYDGWQQAKFAGPAPRLREELRSRPKAHRAELARAIQASQLDNRRLKASERRAVAGRARSDERQDGMRLANRRERQDLVSSQPPVRERFVSRREDKVQDARAGQPARQRNLREQRVEQKARIDRKQEVRRESMARTAGSEQVRAASTRKAMAAKREERRASTVAMRQQQVRERASERQQRQAVQQVNQQRQQQARERASMRQQRQAVQQVNQQRQQQARERASERQQRQAVQQVNQQRQQQVQERAAMRQQRQAVQQVQQQRQQHAQQRAAMRQQQNAQAQAQPQRQQRQQQSQNVAANVQQRQAYNGNGQGGSGRGGKHDR